jgi:pimeloyl-ACP methyl ester carboxylesterase
MKRTAKAPFLLLILLSLTTAAIPQAPADWRDPSPHSTHFITVEAGVRLEVLDWGGTGRAIVLLAGSGNTAHVFDEFAPKLAKRWHIYGITRRGFGASSQPATGYGDQRLADDVVSVLDQLAIVTPVLVGHSMAGGELTTIGREHTHRIAGLVYLDALGDPRDWPGSDPAYVELFKRLPQAESTVAPVSEEEKKSFSGTRAAQLRTSGFAFPESEFRNGFETNRDGTKGEFKTAPGINKAIGDGQIKRDYSGIAVPVLAFFEFPHPANPLTAPAAQVAFDVATATFIDRWIINLLRGAPNVHLIDLPEAGHYVFLTREAEVIAGIERFMGELPEK